MAEPVDLRHGRRDVSDQLALRARSAPTKRQGKRQPKLKTEQVRALGRLETATFGPLAQEIRATASKVGSQVGLNGAPMAPAELHERLERALEPYRTSVAASVQQAVRGRRSDLTKGGIDAMTRTGADTLMFQILLTGKLDIETVHAEMARISDGLKQGALSPSDVKKGLVAVDGLLQRLALAGAGVEYGFQNNGARDLLLSFASSLHR